MSESLNNSPENPFLLSSVPAQWIDELLLYSPEFGTTQSFSQSSQRALSLLIALTIFPLLVAIDLGRYAAKSISSRVWSHIAKNKETRTHAEETAAKSHEVAMKCLRGLAAFPAGAIWRDVVSNHFLPEKAYDGKIHPTGNYYSSAADVKFPKTIDEVEQIVQSAGGRKISIAGAGYAQGKHTLPPTEKDIHINMSNMSDISITNKIAKVEAGATWGELQQVANHCKLAVQVMQASNVFSIGGSLSANCHGWDHTKGSLINTVRAITIVNAEGKRQRLTPEDELFKHVIGGYGMFGVICEAEIELTDNEELYDDAEKIDIDGYVSYFRKNISGDLNKHTKMHLYRLSLERGKLLREGWAQNYTSKSPPMESEKLADEPENGSIMDKILMQIARNSPFVRKLYWKNEVKGFNKIKKGMTRNDIMRPKINAAFANNSIAKTEWLQEYFVPEEKLAEFIHFLGDVLNKNDVTLLNASVRFVSKDDKSAMGYAKKGDRFAVVLFFTQSLNPNEVKKTQFWVQKVVDKLIEIDGTFYLPYAHLATQEQFKKCYPQWAEVKEVKDKYDPNGVFSNGFYKEYFEGEVS